MTARVSNTEWPQKFHRGEIMAGELTGRERILTALDGREPDRAGCALSFFHVDLDLLRLRTGSENIDVDFVSFPEPADEEALRRLAEPHSPDTRLGTPAQAATHARWHSENVAAFLDAVRTYGWWMNFTARA